MEHVILKLMDRLDEKAEMFINAGLKPIAHIDRFRGQPLNPEQFEMYDLPALFYDYRITWQRQGKAYIGQLSWDFHIVLDPTWETANIFTNRAEGLRQLLYHTLLRNALDDFSTDRTSKLIRVDENPEDIEVTNYHRLRYTCDYTDFSKDPDYIETLIEELRLSGHLVKST